MNEDITKFLMETMNHNQSNISSEAHRVTGQFVLQLVNVDGSADENLSDTYKNLYNVMYKTLC